MTTNNYPSFLSNYKFYFLLIVVIAFVVCKQRDTITGDKLIKGGTVIDGTKKARFQSDILINNDIIIWIGDASSVDIISDTVIQANDQIITPGFIDLHAHGDPLETPSFDNFLAMGVTSIALGMDGSSTRATKISSWFDQLDKARLGVNIIPFIGHGTIRTESGIGMSAEVDSMSLSIMTSLLDTAMWMGCWGLSMGLEYMPGYYAQAPELESLARVVGKHNGLITSHIRNEDDTQIDQSLDEMIALLDFCNVNISHLKVVYGEGSARANDIIKKLERDYKSDHHLTADLYPYNASFTGIGIVFPQWAKNPKRYKEIKEQRGDELLEFLRKKVNQRNGPEATLFGTRPYAGKTLKDLVEEYNRPFEIILRDIIGPYGASAAYFVMNDDLQSTLIQSSKVMIASDGSPSMRHPRGHGTFSKMIEEFVVRDSLLTLEEAIYKMSGLPAQTLGIDDRGTISLGAKADILIFDPLHIKSNATFVHPHELSTGISSVIVNGEIARNHTQSLSKNGTLLKKRH